MEQCLVSQCQRGDEHSWILTTIIPLCVMFRYFVDFFSQGTCGHRVCWLPGPASYSLFPVLIALLHWGLMLVSSGPDLHVVLFLCCAPLPALVASSWLLFTHSLWLIIRVKPVLLWLLFLLWLILAKAWIINLASA